MNVGVLEAKNRLSELIDAAERGESVTITRRGAPIVRLEPVANEADRLARALAALEQMTTVSEQIRAKAGRDITWEEMKEDRDFGRP